MPSGNRALFPNRDAIPFVKECRSIVDLARYHVKCMINEISNSQFCCHYLSDLRK